MIDKLLDHWICFLLFFLYIIFTSYMDIFNFQKPRNKGFWCINSKRFDAWHLFKHFSIATIITGFMIYQGFSTIEWIIGLIIYMCIAYFPHELILHKNYFFLLFGVMVSPAHCIR